MYPLVQEKKFGGNAGRDTSGKQLFVIELLEPGVLIALENS